MYRYKQTFRLSHEKTLGMKSKNLLAFTEVLGIQDEVRRRQI